MWMELLDDKEKNKHISIKKSNNEFINKIEVHFEMGNVCISKIKYNLYNEIKQN